MGWGGLGEVDEDGGLGNRDFFKCEFLGFEWGCRWWGLV